MAESHTYLYYVHSNNALVTNYHQLGKGERGESRDWEVCSLGVGDEAHSKCDLCGSQAGSGMRPHQNLQSGARILSIIYHGMICKLSPGILKVSAAQSLWGCSMLSSCSVRKSECFIHRHKHVLLDVHFKSAQWDQRTVVCRRES